MKFSDGYWLGKDNYIINSPIEAYDTEVTDTEISGQNRKDLNVYASYQRLNTRSDMLDVGNSTISLFSPTHDVIGVRIKHFDQQDGNPLYDLAQTPVKTKITRSSDAIKYKSGSLEIEIPLHTNFRMDFKYKGEKITASELKAQASIDDLSGHELGKVMHPNTVTGAQALFKDSDINWADHFMREQLSLLPGTKVYGFGETFGPFEKNGQSIDIINRDGGTGSDQSYKSIPFYLAVQPGIKNIKNGKCYGVFVNESQTTSFEVATEVVDRVSFSTRGESLEYYVIAGDSPKEVIGKYNKLTGGSTLPPEWTFGLWLSTSFTTDYSEKTVMKFIDGMAERDIPLSVFHFDCFWMKGFEWSNFEWDAEKFPDPVGMIKRIHDKGLKVCVWINPYISQKSRLFEIGKENGYFIKKEDGNVWQWDLWQPGNAIVDFTNPDAVEWYQSLLKKLLDMGVDCFKTDFGERIPMHGAVYNNGGNPEGEHNFYTYRYNKAVFDLLKQEKGDGEAVVFARSATVGGQQYPVHWGGDNLSQFHSMADTLRGGLSLMSSGFTFWSHDIGGFEENASPAIYKRWTQFGLLSSHSRYHGNIQYRVPWLFDEEAVEVTRKFSKMKQDLMPYIYKQAAQSVNQGIPLMRPMYMEFPDDSNCSGLDRQYMLGSQILVAPIMEESGVVDYYLPEGEWHHLIDGRDIHVESQGQWLSETYDFLSLPVWQKIQ
ncbi:alpha-xylosidase [Leuconostoc mesenteroides]|uniref:alpha-D-xyloside xylohydrolase n=1 Tax=Leuconostoc mesenteroides subsp. mesenteroides (strain ATCC 8293 / DSM 20343 / BCRC 11652 / CCM 1803 / JCM 6124 / NCDO 523 / NBRC 100496 / NCIMB 8023 / NCTC 12954 / NRRL B-1118 / 37Y) TaxID=203120 RepID=Q03WT1_LEUMM|nr:alpha-xylosidase [Leuconostoc mesenteroides]ABJ62341.1 Alpha-glucosidase, family 31 of glycosyl hydrolase [Leuconostoc mesenteroides subsp. mesenteroides ATCC 8293]MCT3042868.1 alpha-xylosidase [Leuconostoc mesenteroides]MDG9747245.1 alpha-xylosidase [Leuconostoc mesenteroides]QQB30871.1 alpha-xylosidase [Leuconostoc mesenteroides]SPE13953.1 Alpha-xylosidase [Leuconostoc mesenteroides]